MKWHDMQPMCLNLGTLEKEPYYLSCQGSVNRRNYKTGEQEPAVGRKGFLSFSSTSSTQLFSFLAPVGRARAPRQYKFSYIFLRCTSVVVEPVGEAFPPDRGST